ncbi:hypothetical protein ACFZAD_24570 [Streptomyces iakyrus]|uniref:hypothetical protein n=1 Tax=Streptomyces iakyrus TaxID=68219 RepID=UPI0036E94051
MALAYTNDAYVAEQFIPSSQVATQSGKPWVYDRSRFRPSATGGKRAQGANSEEVRMAFTLGTPYFAEDHAKKIFVTDEDVKNAKATNRDPFADATEHVTEVQLIDRETEAATLLTTASNYATDNKETLSGTSQWSDYSNSTPIKDGHEAIAVIHGKLFVRPNKVLIPFQVFNVLQDHPDFLGRAADSNLRVVTPELIARIWNVDQVVIAGAGYNASHEGQADDMQYVWGNKVVFSYVNPSQSEKVLTFARRYQWMSPVVQRLRGTDEEDRRGTWVRRGDNYYDEVIVSNEAGFLFSDVIAES